MILSDESTLKILFPENHGGIWWIHIGVNNVFLILMVVNGLSEGLYVFNESATWEDTGIM